MIVFVEQHDFRAEPAKGLRQFATNGAAAEHREALGQFSQIKNGLVREIICKARDIGHRRAGAGGDDGSFKSEPGVTKLDRLRIDKSGVAYKNVDAEAGESFGGVVMRNSSADSPDALHDFPKVSSRRFSHLDAEFASTNHLGHDSRGANQGLG